MALNGLTAALITENIQGLMNEFLGEEEPVTIPLYSSVDMDSILSGGTTHNQASKKRRLPGYSQVTYKLMEY